MQTNKRENKSNVCAQVLEKSSGRLLAMNEARAAAQTNKRQNTNTHTHTQMLELISKCSSLQGDWEHLPEWQKRGMMPHFLSTPNGSNPKGSDFVCQIRLPSYASKPSS